MFLGLRTVIYPTADLAAAKAFVTRMLGIEPYFDQPFYVGYDVAGYELALDPNGDAAAGATTYWGVADIDVAVAALVEAGATIRSAVNEVGDGIRVATLDMPATGVLGVIENPHFELQPTTGDGPGR
jgi:catechol 2,3-dioxygenase-like lactoylglutathione lyase family enzyme